MKHIVVLGAGLVGRVIAIDLAKKSQVTVADKDADRLADLNAYESITTVYTDLSFQNQIQPLIMDADIVVNALPGFMGYETLKTIIQTGKDVVDISFFPQDALELDELARQHNVTAIVDCGVAPGLGNLLLGHHAETMKIDSFVCYVGGLPIERTWPYEYKAPFSPVDVIEEYIRPARLVENCKLVERQALSEPELIDFGELGTLEAFNTDGLRSLVKTMNIPNMKEKTLRYPGHIELMRVLRETGFFSQNPVQVGKAEISPLDLTTKLLLPKWELKRGEKEFTIMKIIIKGKEQGKLKNIEYLLYDEYDVETETHSMARTTGYTCTAAVSLLIDGNYKEKGVLPPELLAKDKDAVSQMLNYLKERKIELQRKELEN